MVGYELISSGPDGKAGTADDLHDPFGRVLKQGVYAEAVGEEILLARLRGVELGRATVKALAEVFQVEAQAQEDAAAATSARSWEAPEVLLPPSDDLPALDPAPGAAAWRTLGPGAHTAALALPPEPRRYLVVAGALGPDGVATFAELSLEAGVPLQLEASLPRRLGSGESLLVPIRLSSLRDGQRLELQVSSEGPIQARLERGTGSALKVELRAGESRTALLRLSALGPRPGAARVRVRVLDGKGALLRELAASMRVIGDGSLRAQHTGAYVQRKAELRVQLPADARDARLVLAVSSPRDLLGEPGLRELGEAHPALSGWALALRGRAAPRALLDALARRRRSAGFALEPACAAVAWSAAHEEEEVGRDERGARASSELARALAELRSPASMGQRAALLVALAAGAPGASSSESGADPVAALVRQLRDEAWDAVESELARPAVMARLAAGLLLLDRRDAAGRQLFAAARGALIRGQPRGRVLGGDAGREGWVGTVALAIAARQLGEHALADELAAGIAPRLYLGWSDLEAAFWLLAASVYGGLGSASATAVEVRVGGGPSRRLQLREGVGTLALAPGDASSPITVSTRLGEPVLARLEARYRRPVAAARAAPLVASLEGHLGRVGEAAALEISIESTTATAVARPILEVLLPSAAELPEQTRRAIARARGVLRVEPTDLRGLVRFHLRPLEPRERLRLPLPVRWLAGGAVRGLALAVYDGDQPWRVSSVPARLLQLAFPPEEVW